MRQVFVDTETTGLDAAAGDRIVEFACVEMVNRRLSGRSLHRYCNPQRPVHPDAFRVHGLSDEFLRDKPDFAQLVPELEAFLEGAEVVIHNAAFDTSFIDDELRRAGRPVLARLAARVVDSLALARETFPGKSNSLDALCRRLEVDNSNRTLHGALVDATLLAEVYLRMTRGQDTLVMDAGLSGGGDGTARTLQDLSSIDLPVIEPSAQELAAHEAWLQELDKASAGKTVWRTLMT